jgi:RHS repeat-associated protein
LAVPGCGGGGAGGAGQGESVTAQAAQPLTLAEVMPGKIIPAAGVVQPSGQKEIVGSTAGIADVNAFGGAEYDVPIWAPDGVRGMQPALSISYRSNGDYGLLGPKWDLTGLSKISRCRRTLAEDKVTRPLDFSGDTFCLDGERLMRISGSTNGPGEFRTRANPFAKIVAVAATGNGGLSFRIFQTDGRILDYGRTDASRLWGVPRKFPAGFSGVPPAVHTYYVDKVQDRFGNSMHISYINQPTGTHGNVDELVPSFVRWGGVGDELGQRYIEFQYYPAAGGHDFAHKRYVSGLGIYPGQRLKELRIFAPDGTGLVPLLKVYKFSYSVPTITAESLLEKIAECDGNNVCKRPTEITWELGSLAYDTGQAMPWINEVQLQGYTGYAPPNPTYPPPGANHYRRIMVADLNNDGRDDIVYRAYYGDCLRWLTRLAEPGSTLGIPIDLGIGDDTDPRCSGPLDPQDYSNAYPDDPIITDIGRDNFPDIVIPVGYADLYGTGGDLTSFIQTYRAHLNLANPGSWVGFRPGINFEDPWDVKGGGCQGCTFTGQVVGNSPQIAIGDVNGDALQEILRPNITPWWPYGSLWAASVQPCTSPTGCGQVSADVQLATIPEIYLGSDMTNFYTLDLDGDGIAEVLREDWSGSNTTITSPTMNGPLPVPPSNSQWMEPRPHAPPATRWTLDLNGDGLPDFATVYASDALTIVTNINNGKGFDADVRQTLAGNRVIGTGWQSGYEAGARIVDYNLDGRDDLVLVDADPYPEGGTMRSKQIVLLSDGTGQFSSVENSIPIGDPADGRRGAFNWDVYNGHGYRTSVSLDYNGDGLPDFLQLEGGIVKLYTRQGKMPDMVTRIREGTGRMHSVEYVPVTDSAVYTPDLSVCANEPEKLVCLTSDRLVVKSLTESGDSRLSTRTYRYEAGTYDRRGIGFLGFRRIYTDGPRSERVTTTYDNLVRLDLPNGYAYPLVGQPAQIETWVDTSPGPYGARFTRREISYSREMISFGQFHQYPQDLYSMTPQSIQDSAVECLSQGVSCTQPLPATRQTFSYDPLYGTLLSEVTEHMDGDWNTVQTDSVTNTYYPVDTANWLTGVLQQKQVTSTTVSPAKSMTRTTRFTPNPDANATTSYLTGETRSIEFEPGGDTSVHMMRTFGHDARGRVSFAWDADYPTSAECNATCNPECYASCQSGCAGSANPGSCISGCMAVCMGSCIGSCLTTPRSGARVTSFKYEDADGVYVTTTVDPMANTTRVFRHPGLGLIVRTEDENGAATSHTYDSFGRPLSQTAASGASITATHDDSTASNFLGSNHTLIAGGSTLRATQIRLDPFGNPLTESAGIDASRKLVKNTTYDAVGRAFRVEFLSSTASANTVLNTKTVTYDDLDRVVSECQLTASDGANHCKTNTHNGLAITSSNEAGRSVVAVHDALGRLSKQQASIGAGLSTASFVYGPFGQLEHQDVEDGSGSSDFAYDVLGRLISMTRKNAGVRRTTYNAFGDVTSTHKVDSTGVARETVTFGRDKLGRITTMTSPGAGTAPGTPPAINRRFYWDAGLTPGGTFTRGKLNDVVDTGNQTSVHFDYNAAGLLRQKSLTVFNASLGASGANETYTASFIYDTQGRLDTLTYPKVPTESQPFAAKYAYDSYTGAPSSIKDAGNLSSTIWSVSGRNELGDVTNEALKLGTTNLTRETSYFLQDGQVKTASLGTSLSRTQLDYTYQHDGLPLTFARTGVGGSSTATFDNDNLGRLISWKPSSSAPTVTYSYDSDGNLLSRNWSGETITYGTTVSGGLLTARTVRTKRGTNPSQTDTYRVDAYGRMVETPAVNIRMTDDDRIGSITQKSNGQVDTVMYDGLGDRVFTLFGDRGSAGSVLEFSDIFELKRDGTNSTTGTEGRCRLRAGDRLVGDVVRKGTASRTATFYLVDNVHSVVAEASSGGTVTARTRRDPFGNSFTSSTTPYLPSDPAAADPDGTSRLGFGSHNRDKGWGLVDMHLRAYSPRLGRFISPDLVIANAGDRREFNPFAYVQNNPTAKFDPLGLSGGGVSGGGPPASGLGGPPGGVSGPNGTGGQTGTSGAKDGGRQNASGGGSRGGDRGGATTPGNSGARGAGGGRGDAYNSGSRGAGAISGWYLGGSRLGPMCTPRSGAGGKGGGVEHINFPNGSQIHGGASRPHGGSSSLPGQGGQGGQGGRGGQGGQGGRSDSSSPAGGTGGTGGTGGRGPGGYGGGIGTGGPGDGGGPSGVGGGYAGHGGQGGMLGGWGGGNGTGGGTGYIPGRLYGLGDRISYLGWGRRGFVGSFKDTFFDGPPKASTVDAMIGYVLPLRRGGGSPYGQTISQGLGAMGFSVGNLGNYGKALYNNFNQTLYPLSPHGLYTGMCNVPSDVSALGSVGVELLEGFAGGMEGGGAP